jgi:hypothetical protein
LLTNIDTVDQKNYMLITTPYFDFLLNVNFNFTLNSNIIIHTLYILHVWFCLEELNEKKSLSTFQTFNIHNCEGFVKFTNSMTIKEHFGRKHTLNKFNGYSYKNICFRQNVNIKERTSFYETVYSASTYNSDKNSITKRKTIRKKNPQTWIVKNCKKTLICINHDSILTITAYCASGWCVNKNVITCTKNMFRGN